MTALSPEDQTSVIIDLLDTITARQDQDNVAHHVLLTETLVKIGLLGICEDCMMYVWPDDKDVCLHCGHINGDPTTGSTPDDREMRVCNPCWANDHGGCDGGDPHDLEQVFCNCKRLGHPTVTAIREG